MRASKPYVVLLGFNDSYSYRDLKSLEGELAKAGIPYEELALKRELLSHDPRNLLGILYGFCNDAAFAWMHDVHKAKKFGALAELPQLYFDSYYFPDESMGSESRLERVVDKIRSWKKECSGRSPIQVKYPHGLSARF